MKKHIFLKNKNRHQGFSLLEVLITIVVISVGLVAMAKFQAVVLQDSTLAKNRTVAINLAQDQIETLRNTDFANLASGSDKISSQTITNLTETFTREWTVVTVDDSAAVTVKVTWPDYTSGTGKETDNTTIQLISAISNSPSESTADLLDPSR